MSLHRRPVGRGRLLAAFASIVLLIGCVPPWWTAGSSDTIPPISENAFEGPGIAVFLIALATLALITLPYASDRPVSLDRWWAYGALAVVGWVALTLRVADIVLKPGGLESITPDRGPGVWITVAGLAILSRAVWQISREPVYR